MKIVCEIDKVNIDIRLRFSRETKGFHRFFDSTGIDRVL